MEKNKFIKKNFNDKYIQLFKQFIKYKKHLLNINKNKEVESLYKKIQNEIKIINNKNKKNINNDSNINKYYLYLIKGSINIIENFWEYFLLKKNRIKKTYNNIEYSHLYYKTYQKKFY